MVVLSLRVLEVVAAITLGTSIVIWLIWNLRDSLAYGKASPEQISEIIQSLVKARRCKFFRRGWLITRFRKRIKEAHIRRGVLRWILFVRPHARFLPFRLFWAAWRWAGSDIVFVLRSVRKMKLSRLTASLIINEFRRTGIAAFGFPIFEFKAPNELLAETLFQFAYATESIDPTELWKHWHLKGAYRIFLKRTAMDRVECRLLLVTARKAGGVHEKAMVIELSKTEEGKWRIRSGPVAPALDSSAVMLSDEPPPSDGKNEWRLGGLQDIVTEHCSPANIASPGIFLDRYCRTSETIAGKQDLFLYTIENCATETFRGKFLHAEYIGDVVGRQIGHITASDLQLVSPYFDPNRKHAAILDADRDLIQLLRQVSDARLMAAE